MAGPRILGQAVGTGALANVYTAPPGSLGVIVSSIVLASLSGGTAEIRLAPSGETNTTKHVFLPTYTVSPGEHVSLTEGVTLGTGDVIRVNASSTVNVHIFGTEL